MNIRLPYFDVILSRLDCGDPEFETAFGRHIHFGAWEDPAQATGDPADTAQAMERLTQHLIQRSDIGQGQAVLDAGCGFGGTVASLNEQFSGLRLTGLNIDERQIAVARRRVTARPGNRIDFVVGDACDMGFEAASFDRILAVECIFHFPSRAAFFGHVARVLRPGGNLTISDFLQPEGTPAAQYDDERDFLWGPHTAIDIPAYQDLADRFGLALTHVQDITPHIRPSYEFYGRILGPYLPGALESTRTTQFFMDLGAFGYCTLRFDKVEAPNGTVIGEI